jgi:small-conductance mechanosensitive channel
MQTNIKKKRNPLITATIEIIIGIVLSLIVGKFVSAIIAAFIPEYISYTVYINQAILSAIIIIVGLIVTNTTLKYFELKLSPTRKELYGISLLVRTIIYIIILAFVLSVFHVNVTDLLLGSAIGGVVLGLAVQTVTSNLLSSIFVTSTGTLKYGDVVNINSGSWSIDTTGKIIEIKTLFSKMLTKDNNIINIPNSALLGSAAIVEYRENASNYIYPVNITILGDVPVDKIIELVKEVEKDIDIYFFAKSGFHNVLLVLIRFADVLEMNKKISDVNSIIDKAYWDIKSKMLLIGNNAMYDYNQTDKIYPLIVTLNSNVPSDKIIENVRKLDNSINVNFVSKNGSNNIFSANFQVQQTSEIAENVTRINTLFEDVYNKLKDNNDHKI